MTTDDHKEPAPPTLKHRVQNFAHSIWYGDSRAFIALLPLSWLFAGVSALRRFLYRRGLIRSFRMPVPVIVVGNITAGGAGKTPVSIWLAEALRALGKNPAIISRGYGGRGSSVTEKVGAASDSSIVGDEPVLLAKRSGCDVFVDANRVLAAQAAAASGADIIISDDGLQHYRLQRDAEIVVIDGSRGLGNGYLLPAGPLREGEGRLDGVDRIMIQSETDDVSMRYGNRANDRRTTRFLLAGDTLVNILDGSSKHVSELQKRNVHAVAAIAHPERFFRSLEAKGLNVQRHPLADHSAISQNDLTFDDDLDVIVTEKDAVKCNDIAHARVWALPVDIVVLGDDKLRWLESLITRLNDKAAATKYE